MNACFSIWKGAKICTKLQNTLLFCVPAVASFGWRRDPLKIKVYWDLWVPPSVFWYAIPIFQWCVTWPNTVLESNWGRITDGLVVHDTDVERWERSALNFAVYSTLWQLPHHVHCRSKWNYFTKWFQKLKKSSLYLSSPVRKFFAVVCFFVEFWRKVYLALTFL